MLPTVSQVESRILYSSARLRFAVERFATPDGAVERPVLHHPGAVALLARPRPGALLLVRQYRYPIARWTLEIPAGTSEPDEEPRATAARELAEEAGMHPHELHELLRFYPSVGVSSELLIIYRAEGLRPVPTGPDHGELVSPAIVADEELPALIAEGAICDGKTLLALALCGLWPGGKPA